MNRQPVLEINNLSKTFGATRALRDVDFEIAPNETHALVGQNGSGKSTLIKVLSGYHQPDPGATIRVGGTEWLGAGGDRHEDRIRFVHQDLGLILALNAIDNVAMHGGTYAKGALGRVRWRTQEAMTRELLHSFGVDFDVRRPLSEVSPVQRVVVAIAAALQSWDANEGLLVLDEPTSVMSQADVARLFTILDQVRSRGVSILYVSHRLDEVFEIADRVTVLRGGARIDTCAVSEVTKAQLVARMLGREMEADYRAVGQGEDTSDVALEARGVYGRYVRGVDLSLRRGEIVGVAGLAGSGREEIGYALAGTLGSDVSGEMRVPALSDDWVGLDRAASLGVVLVPADRATEGVVAQMSVGENLSLSVLGRLGGWGRLSAAKEDDLVLEWLERLEVVCSSPADPITTLSGGNQQKVLIGRCLASTPKLLVLCEPTAGVDIGARRTIYDFLAQQMGHGLTVLVSTSDTGDLLAICTRVLVMRDGAIVCELEGDAITEHAIVHAMEGTLEGVG
jgi:ABC-type sugar transport system ATPase subunit